MQVDFNKYNLDETVENYLLISMFESIIETNETYENSKGNPYRDPKTGQFDDAPFSKKIVEKGGNRKKIDEAKKQLESQKKESKDSEVTSADAKKVSKDIFEIEDTYIYHSSDASIEDFRKDGIKPSGSELFIDSGAVYFSKYFGNSQVGERKTALRVDSEKMIDEYGASYLEIDDFGMWTGPEQGPIPTSVYDKKGLASHKGIDNEIQFPGTVPVRFIEYYDKDSRTWKKLNDLNLGKETNVKNSSGYNPYRDPKSGEFTDAPFSTPMVDGSTNRSRIDREKESLVTGDLGEARQTAIDGFDSIGLALEIDDDMTANEINIMSNKILTYGVPKVPPSVWEVISDNRALTSIQFMHKKSTNSNANGDYDLDTGVLRIFWEEARMGLPSQHKIPSVFVHEIGHAYDRALGGGRMFSDTDAGIQKAYNAYKNTPWSDIVTEYAKTDSREFFAESFMERQIGSGLYKGAPEMNEFFNKVIEE